MQYTLCVYVYKNKILYLWVNVNIVLFIYRCTVNICWDAFSGAAHVSMPTLCACISGLLYFDSGVSTILSVIVCVYMSEKVYSIWHCHCSHYFSSIFFLNNYASDECCLFVAAYNNLLLMPCTISIHAALLRPLYRMAVSSCTAHKIQSKQMRWKENKYFVCFYYFF